MASIEEQIRRIVREEVQAALRARPTPSTPAAALLTCSEVARELGTNARALRERFRRELKAGRVHPLAALAVEHDGVKRWPRAAVAEYVATLVQR